MAFTGCNYCCHPDQLANDPWTYRTTVLRLLCAILEASGGIPGAAVILPQVAVAFGALNAAFTDLGFLDSTFRLSRFYIDNQTDADIAVSLDGGATTHFTVFANSSLEREFPGYQGAALDSVQVKYINVPTQGTAYFDGSY